MEEQWKPVVGYEGSYEVSNLGRVRSVSRVISSIKSGKPFHRKHQGKILAPRINRWGYQQIHLGKETTTHSIHKLVAQAFICIKPSPRHQVNHINGVKTDNRVANLEWVSCSENVQHAFGTGLNHHSERSSATSLTADQVMEIRRRRNEGEKLVSLASAFGMSVSGVHAIAQGKNWKHLTSLEAQP